MDDGGTGSAADDRDASDVVAIAHSLYALPPAEFVPARNARAKAVRASGDRDGARVVAALRRPSVGAWVVDVLVRERPDDVADLLATGTRLLAAQAAGDGVALRDLTRRRHEQTAALRRRAAALADAAGQRLSDTVATAVEGTLHAAMADAGAAAAVRTGLLVRDLTSTGFDPVDLVGAVAVPDAPPLLAPSDDVRAPAPGEAGSRAAGGTGDGDRGDGDAGADADADADEPTRTLPGRRTAPRTSGHAVGRRGAAREPGERGATDAPAVDERATDERAAEHRAVEQRATEQHAAERRAAERRAAELAAARRELAKAERRATEARTARRAADAAVDRAGRRRADVAAEVDRLSARLAELRGEARTADRDHRRTVDEREAADAGEAEAADAVRAARDRLDGLR